jgi:alpha-galactosidase
MKRTLPLTELDSTARYRDCVLRRYPDESRLRIASDRVFRDFYVIDRTLYSGGFGTPSADVATDVLVQTYHLEFLDGLPRGEFALELDIPSESDGEDAEFRVTLYQAVGPYEVRFALLLLPGSPFITSFLSLRGPAVADDRDAGGVDRNLAFTSMEEDASARSYRLSPPSESVDSLPHEVTHGSLRRVVFYDDTDRNDQLIEEIDCSLYGRYGREYEGNIFLVRDRPSGLEFLIMKEGPTIHGSLRRNCGELYWHDDGFCSVRGTGIDPSELRVEEFLRAYGCTVGAGRGIAEELRAFLGATGPKTGRQPFALANTWGDRNRDASLSDSFVRAEIDAAAELGIDYLQVDDGWQRGITKNSGLAAGGVWEGYYATDPEFWQVHRGKFPGGLEPLVEYGRERGVKLSLWFSPDSSGSFANWKRDAQVLLGFHRSLGIDQFKLDGIKIRDKAGEANLLRLLSRIEEESGGAIDYCMDVTAEIRLGYLYERQRGKIFVENRYTDWGNYYPYRTLRNLWALSRYLPASRLQIEVLNNRRNQQVYGSDPLAPASYGLDYLFAIALPATPLFFMELTGLPADARAELAAILPVYRSIRSELCSAEAIPIGDEPDGYVFSGFQCALPDGGGYMILLRDNTAEAEYCFELPRPAARQNGIELLYASAPVELDLVARQKVRFRASRKRTVAVLRY